MGMEMGVWFSWLWGARAVGELHGGEGDAGEAM